MLRFDGKVAIVTGAGRGLGRAHALLLAERGAKVVVNVGHSTEEATSVVKEIKDSGGEAIMHVGPVNTAAEELVQLTVDTYGKIDIVLNNAGINALNVFGPDSVPTIKEHMDVNFFGGVAVTAAAWPYLIESGQGRVVFTSSPTLSGFQNQGPYVASKGAISSFVRTLSMEALDYGIRVNALAPSAYTRMVEGVKISDSLREKVMNEMRPEMCSPVTAYMCHESCAITGETIMSQGGLNQRFVLSLNKGYKNPDATIEDIVAHMDEILDDSTQKVLGIIGTASATSLEDIAGQ